jgi:uncharacterized protein (TIGR02145 family)
MGGLEANTHYFYRAFAVNSAGEGYGELREFKTPHLFGLMTDERDGRVYHTIRIGEQVWMADNLKFGEMIDSTELPTDNEIVEKYCYNNDPGLAEAFGGLYKWHEAMNYQLEEGSQGICPDGWHIPTDLEWKILEVTIGLPEEFANNVDMRGGVEGGRLKAPLFDFWFEPNAEATNETGFSAMGAGEMSADGYFQGLGAYTVFWTSSIAEEPEVWFRALSHDHGGIYRGVAGDILVLSVRCIQDQ